MASDSAFDSGAEFRVNNALCLLWCVGTLPILYDAGATFPKSEPLALSTLLLFDALLRGNLDPVDFLTSMTTGTSCATAVVGIMTRFPGRYVTVTGLHHICSLGGPPSPSPFTL